MAIERNFAGDPNAHLGYWGPPTSIANFCEEDYAMTVYVAEVVNSITNLTYVYFAITTLRRGESLLSTTAFPNLALFFVGVMSFAFHLTLQQPAQLADDLSMFWVCAALIYELYTIGRSSTFKFVVGAALTVTLTVISAVHCVLDALWLHNWTFIILVTMIWPRALVLISRTFRGAEKKEWTATFRTGGLCFLGGFILWAIDGVICHRLREVRAVVGLPLAWLLELHGWWHILTAVGARNVILLVKRLTQDGETMAKAAEGKKAK